MEGFLFSVNLIIRFKVVSLSDNCFQIRGSLVKTNNPLLTEREIICVFQPEQVLQEE